MESARCLFSTGSNIDGIFSLSSDEYEPEIGSLEKQGVVGVSGMSSDISDIEAIELVGVLSADAVEERLGVTGGDV